MIYESPLMILASPGRIPICVLSGIDEHSVSLRERSNNTDLLSFEIHKYVDGELSNGYNWIDEQMELYVDGVWYCINNPPSTEFDSYDEIKTVSAESDEIKLLQYMLTDFAVNMGVAHSYEYMYKQAHDPDSDKYYQVKFYDEDNPELSLLHIVLSHGEVPGWKIGYVDDLTVNSSDNKTFLPDEICYFDITEQSVYSFLTQEVSTTCRCVFEFDTKNMLINVYRAESLGKDTNVLLDFQNVQNSINISRDKQLVTVFDVKGESPIDISYVNPVGGSLIEYLSFFCKKPYMTDILIQKYKAWCELRDSYKDEYFNLTLEYHRLQDIINELTDRVPTDSAINDWTTASVEDLQEAYNTNMAIVKGLESKFQGTNDQIDYEALKASEDWELYESIRNYTIPAIVAALQNKQSLPDGTTDYGSGNYIQNPVPVSLGTTWQTTGSGTFSCVHLDDQPDFGMASGVKIVTSEGAGIRQTEIKTTVGTSYCISVYVKPTSNTTLKIIHQDSSSASTATTNYVEKSFNLTVNTWQRVYCSFSAPTQLCDVIFYLTSGTATFTGMQMELGTTPKLFSYYIYGDSELKAYETDWALYGVDELEAKLAVYQNNVDIMTKNGYSIPWSEQSSYDEPYHTQLHQKYLDYVKLRDDCQNALNERITERTPYEEEATAVNQQRVDINTKLQKENFGTSQSTYEGFTEKELFTLNSLRNQQTYTNPNIVSTSLTTMQDIVHVQKTLYDDAMDRLYVEAHPQYTYSDDVDNILALPEFSEFHDELEVNNFIRIVIDDSDTYVKLRVTEIESNPFTNENNLQIVFSNMVMYRSERDDLAYLINETRNASSKGQVVGNTNNDVINYLLTPEVITKLFANSSFQAGLGGVAVGGSGSGGNINAEKIVAELVKADEGVFGSITADTGLFKYIDSEIINASQLFADVGHFKDIVTGKIKAEEGEFIKLSTQNAIIDEAFVKSEIAQRISVADLATHTATAEQIVLISDNGKPGIAFQNSTQQFYDANGNVRVQIGQDANGDFNFSILDETGKGVLIDETGIKPAAIEDGLIVNQMIKDATISAEKLSFKVNVDENGHVLMSSIYHDGKEFSQVYTEFTEDYDKFKEDALVQYSKIEQNAGMIKLLVSNTEDESSLTLTPTMIEAMTKQFVVKSPDGKRVVISNGILSADALKSNNYSYSSGNYSTAGTYLNLADGSIRSKNFAIDSSGNAYLKGTIYATSGEFTGDIKSGSTITCGNNFKVTSDGKLTATNASFTGAINSGSTITCGNNFSVDASGNMKVTNGQFSGTITGSSITCGDYFSVSNTGVLTAKSGTIGGWTIGTSSLYNQTKSLTSTIQGIYLGTDGILNYNAADRYVKITQGQIIANSGNIGGFTLENHRLVSEILSEVTGDELATSSGISIDANNLTIRTWYGESIIPTDDWFGYTQIWGESIEASYGNFNVINLIGSNGESDGYIYGEKCIFNHGEFNQSLGTLGSLSVGENLNVAGKVVFSNTGDASGTTEKNPVLIIGDSTAQHLEFDNNEIMSKKDGVTTGKLFLNTDGGPVIFHNAYNSFEITVEEGEWDVLGHTVLRTGSDLYLEGNSIICHGDKVPFSISTEADATILRSMSNIHIEAEKYDDTHHGCITFKSAGYWNSSSDFNNGSIQFQDYDSMTWLYMSYDSTSSYVGSKAILNRATTSGTTVRLDSSGVLGVYSSASKYKLNIEPIFDETYAYNLLKVNPKTWYDKNEVESYSRAITADIEGKDPVEVCASYETAVIERVPGLIAEDVQEAGLSEYCHYRVNTENNTKEIEGIDYEKLTTLLIPIMRDVVLTLQEVVPVVKEHIQDENIITKLNKLQSRFDSFKEAEIIQ